MILTVEQTAELLHLRPKTVRLMAAAGVIPAAKVGKFWRFEDTVLNEWVAEHARENVRPCPSSAVRGPGISRSASNSLGERLDALLASPTGELPKSSRSSFAVVTGGKSS